MMRGSMIPHDNTMANLLRPEQSTDWLHMDPWRVLRIQAEFVDGFGALAELGPAVSIFGSARVREEEQEYQDAVRMGRGVAERGIAVITGEARVSWRPRIAEPWMPAANRWGSASSCRMRRA